MFLVCVETSSTIFTCVFNLSWTSWWCLRSFILDMPLLLLRLPPESLWSCYFRTTATTTTALSLQSNCEHIYLTSVLCYVPASCFQFPVVAAAASFINWRSHCRKITTLSLPADQPRPSFCLLVCLLGRTSTGDTLMKSPALCSLTPYSKPTPPLPASPCKSQPNPQYHPHSIYTYIYNPPPPIFILNQLSQILNTQPIPLYPRHEYYTSISLNFSSFL